MQQKLVAIGLLAGALVSSHSATSEAAVERVQFRGEIATLSLFKQSEVLCEDGEAGTLDTSVSLQLFADGVRSNRGNSDTKTIMVFFSQFNSCTAERLEFIGLEEPAEYRQQRVKSASFAHTFDMLDEFTGDPIGTLTLDLELTGVGPTGRINEHTRTESGGFTFHSHVNGAFREATASGTLTLDDLDLSDASHTGSLTDVHSGDITITH